MWPCEPTGVDVVTLCAALQSPRWLTETDDEQKDDLTSCHGGRGGEYVRQWHPLHLSVVMRPPHLQGLVPLRAAVLGPLGACSLLGD